jgi:iron complex outermembrane receptor protein
VVERNLGMTVSFRRSLAGPAAAALLAASGPVVAQSAASGPVVAQTAASGPVVAQTAIPPQADATRSESIVVREKRLLQKEKNSPSAVTELGRRQIAAVGVSGSPASLLRQAPSVYVYQQGLGDNDPQLTIRGLRGLEIATTLDGVPTQDLLAPGNFYLANNLGGVFTLNQISGVHIYPGVAYPDKNTFGTIGGTVAYDSKRPTDDFYLDLTGSAGSFGTYKEGFELNSGELDSPLGTGGNALKVLLNYYNLQSQGYIDSTAIRENEMEFALDKPYDDGLSHFQVTVLYNTANGYVQNEPLPLPYLDKYGLFSNYPTSLTFNRESNDYKTLIVKDDTYINDYIQALVTGFYIGGNSLENDYGDINLSTPNGVAGPLTVGGAPPFINTFAGFGDGGIFGPPMPPPLGIFGGGLGYGGFFYGRGHTYNPYALYPIGSKNCPAALAALYEKYQGNANLVPCGLNDELLVGHTDTYGIQPRVEIIPPEIDGIGNTIKIGALIAKETSPTGPASDDGVLGQEYFGGTPNTPQDAAHAFGDEEGGTWRIIYQGYAQDKIDLFGNTLHITPGFTVEGTYSGDAGDAVFLSKDSAGFGPNGFFGPNSVTNGGTGTNIDRYGPYKATKWDRDWLPFINVSYDFDRILPAAKGLTAYGSFGNSALFAPVGDFGPNTVAEPPYASIVHMYEAGVKYDTSTLLIALDYFYQKIDRDFGFFNFQSGPQNGESDYTNFGQRESKGVEGSVIWQVTPALQLFANFSHQLTKYLTNGFAFVTVAEDQYGISLKGDPVSGIPDWLSTFGADFTHRNEFTDGDTVDARLTGQYTGHQNTTYDLGSNAYTTVPNFPGLAPLNYTGCTGNPATNTGCLAYTRYNQVTGSTVYDPHGGISPFAVFSLDLSYKLPTPQLHYVKNLTFDLNIQNLFDQRYFQYFYKQMSPGSCGTIKSGPFAGLAANSYSCSPSFGDALPGQPFGAFFTVTARF